MVRESRFRTLDVARLGVERAKRWLAEAQDAGRAGRYDNAVYCAQMAVEQAAKALLIAAGIGYPREHDVSDEFARLADRLDVPAWFRSMVGEFCGVIAELARVRGAAGYGYEMGFSAGYFRDYAPSAISMAKKFVVSCRRVLEEARRSQ